MYVVVGGAFVVTSWPIETDYKNFGRLGGLSHETFDPFIDHRGSPSAPQVFAWDTDKNAVDEDEDDGRSYISAVSEIVTDESETCSTRAKTTMGEARMDIEDSEMAYLGFHDSESYGLTWKV